MNKKRMVAIFKHRRQRKKLEIKRKQAPRSEGEK